MAKKIGIGIAAVVALLLVFIATRPSTFRVERTARVGAPPAVTFAQIQDLRAWSEWSPWDKMDPNMKRTYEGAPAGEGAVYRWSGNDKVGEGSMTIVETRAPELVAIRLDFVKPFASTNDTRFQLSPEGDGTRVVWSMEGKNDFLGKAFSVFMDMDGMIGKDFEAGLAALDTVASRKAAQAP